MSDTDDTKKSGNAALKAYSTPLLKEYGDIRHVSKGTVAYSLEEGAYQEMNPPSGQ